MYKQLYSRNILKTVFVLSLLSLFSMNIVSAQEATLTPETYTPTSTETATPTETPEFIFIELTILRDVDSLTIYVPDGQEFVSLNGFSFQVTTATGQEIVRQLGTDFASFLGMPFSNLASLTPMCFRLVRNGSNVPVPQVCQGSVLNLTESLAPADVFWRDFSINQDRLILIRMDNRPLGVCAGNQVECRVRVESRIPTPTPTSTSTSTSTVTEAPALIVSTSTPTDQADEGNNLTSSPLGPNITAEAVTITNVRERDSTAFSVIGQLNAGDVVPIIGRSSTGSGWYLIELFNGNQGWVAPTVIRVTGNVNSLPTINPLSNEEISDENASSNETATATAATMANIRAGDSTAFAVVGQLNVGDIVPVIGRSSTGSGWYLVELSNGKQGWMSPAVVTITGDAQNLPRVEPPTR